METGLQIFLWAFLVYLATVLIYHVGKRIVPTVIQHTPALIYKLVAGFPCVIGKLLWWALLTVLFVIFSVGALLLMCLTLPFICFPILFI